MDDFVWGRRVGATSVALGALNHRHAAYQSPRATEVAPTVCRAAAAKGTAINPALPLPFDKLINGRVNNGTGRIARRGLALILGRIVREGIELPQHCSVYS